MKRSWTAGLSEEKATEIRTDFIGSLATRRRLEEMINDKIKASTAFTRSKENYDVANWAYLQADAIGYERALIEIISLISDKSVEKE